jgi:hypothetical protein
LPGGSNLNNIAKSVFAKNASEVQLNDLPVYPGEKLQLMSMKLPVKKKPIIKLHN